MLQNAKIKLVECVPNFSEGRDKAKMERIIDCFRGQDGMKLLDYSNDTDHNRMVITALGSPEIVKRVMVEAIGTAIHEINLTQHKGKHPRLGAADVIPFIPVKNMTMKEAIQLSKDVSEEVAHHFDLPVYLYEKAASAPHRENLAEVRKGEFEGLSSKMESPLWQPDYGPSRPHPTAGASIIGAREFLIAYNINLNTPNLQIANDIAKKIRFSSGGIPYCKALGVMLDSIGCAQVSMNLTDFRQTAVHTVFEAVKAEAALHGVTIRNSEVIGMLPLGVLVDTTCHYFQIDDFTINRVLEYQMLE
jgi:glutamate formiminotransferase / 5-formyltetrahydrofolate cyclo-ligase